MKRKFRGFKRRRSGKPYSAGSKKPRLFFKLSKRR